MSFTLLAVVGVLSVLLLGTVVLSRGSGFAGVAGSFFAIGMAVFCGVGFLASFELSASQSMPWLLAYSAMGLASLLTGVLGLKRVWNRKKHP